MSWIGRDYLQVGFYTEVMFKEKEVHFIAIANGVDNQKRESSEFAPFLNIMNEWYIRDSSRKVTTVLRARGMEGKHTTNNAIYGYRKSEEDKNQWVIDEEAAEVVRRIYRMSLEGKGPYAFHAGCFEFGSENVLLIITEIKLHRIGAVSVCH